MLNRTNSRLNKQLALGTMMAAVMLTSACASTRVKPASLSKVQKVALVGFTRTVDLSHSSDKSIASSIGSTIEQAETLANVANATGETYSAPVRAAYEELADRVAKDTRWQVIGLDELVANDGYLQLSKAIRQPGDSFSVAGLLEFGHATRFTVEQRRKLLEALQVDAIIVADLKVHVGTTSGFAVGGIGTMTKHPQGLVRLVAYDRDALEPIWEEEQAAGEPTESGITNVMGVKDNRDREATVAEATTLAFDELINRYRAEATVAAK